MYEKVIAVLLTFSLLFCLTACGSPEKTTSSPSGSETLSDPEKGSDPSGEEQKDSTGITSVVHPDFALTDGFIEPVEPKDSAPEGYIPLFTPEELDKVRLNPGANYILMADIDLSGSTFESIGVEEAFFGILDGNGYTVSNAGVPLFERVSGGMIQNLHIEGQLQQQSALLVRFAENAAIQNCWSSGSILETEGGHCGGLLFKVTNCNIISCYNTADITADTASYAGGIAALAEENNTFTNCFNTGTILCDSNNEDTSAGGILGYTYTSASDRFSVIFDQCCNSGAIDAFCAAGILGNYQSRSEDGVLEISRCYNSGVITGNSRCFIAGICNIVELRDSDVWIGNCYNIGDLTGSSGICGGESFFDNGWDGVSYDFDRIHIQFCHNAGGSLLQAGIAYDVKNLNQCYFLNTTAETATHDGALFASVRALTSDEMKNQESFEGFDFETVWQMGENGYPVFQSPLYTGIDGIG